MMYVKQSTRKKHTVSSKLGRGLVNSLLNKLPLELHLLGYHYCGHGTKLEKRVARDAAWERFNSKDAKFGKRAAAWLVTNMMKGKQRLGMGCRVQKSKVKRSITKKRMYNRRIKKNNLKKKKCCKKVAFGSGVVNKVHNTLRTLGGNRLFTYGLKKASDIALKVTRKHLESVGRQRHIRTPRVIPITKVGGLLPLLSIFAGHSELGSLAGAAAGITKAVQTAKSSREQLEEANRHNKKM